MFGGEVEVDETYIGGKARNMHKADRERKIDARGGMSGNKTPVIGMIERGGRVRAQVLDDLRGRTVRSYVHDTVEPGSTVYTDSFKSYIGLGRDYDHKVIDHAVAYVDGNIHTNFIENFWSLLKRAA
jgi:transposase-like protein